MIIYPLVPHFSGYHGNENNVNNIVVLHNINLHGTGCKKNVEGEGRYEKEGGEGLEYDKIFKLPISIYFCGIKYVLVMN